MTDADSQTAMALPTPAGILLIDKQPGFTSMDVCAIVRARLRRGGAPKRVKVGHAGTLDPMATGLLVVLIGKATRLCDLYMGGRKTYIAEIDLSRNSTTDDAEGEITQVDVSPAPSRAALERAIAPFRGVIEQRPPAFSAMKVGGRRAYALARDGTPPMLAPRPVEIFEYEVEEYAWPLARMRVVCGKGTYIRSLARDLGVALGTGGMLTALRRTSSGAHYVNDAKTLDALPDVLMQRDLLALPATESQGP